MSEQNGTQKLTGKQIVTTEEVKRFREKWKEHWKSKGQPWRLMPEIDEERQKFLVERRSITPNLEKDIYPFKDIKLNRADVEWLLVTHENGRGPIDWSDESQRDRFGLDLRGADLRGEYLAYLPLACMGRVESEIEVVGEMKYKFPRTNSATIHLEGAILINAQLEEADLSMGNLEKAAFNASNLEKVDFTNANLKGAMFLKSNLKNAFLWEVQLQGADLSGAHLEGAVIKYADLSGANIQEAFFDNLTRLNDSKFGDKENGAIALADVHWGDVNVAVINWSTFSILGDESVADHEIDWNGEIKVKGTRLNEYQTAVRAYRQLSVVLRNQGLNEDAARFTYRAQLMQRVVFKRQRKYGQYLFSLFLGLLSGYGYKPLRCFIAYFLVILAFTAAYFIIGHKVGPVLSPLGSFVFSVTSFHGRGFFPGGIALDDPLTVVAALEAFIGLLIEVTFIATLTQRLFGR